MGRVSLEELQEDYKYHSFSWLTLNELLDFDYKQTFCDKGLEANLSKGINNAALAEKRRADTLLIRTFR